MPTRIAWLLPASLLTGLLVAIPQDPARQEGLYFDSGGVQIHYTVDGEGAPVVLLHGLCGSIDLNWRRTGVIEALAEDHRVVAIDLRAHGKSATPDYAYGYGIELAKDVIRILDHLEIEEAHLISYSYGGTVALKILATWPERLISVVLGETSWARDGDDEAVEYYEDLADAFAGREGIGNLLRSLTPDGDAPPTEQQIAEISAGLEQVCDLQALDQLLRGSRELFVSTESLRQNEVPCLVLFGERSPPAVESVIAMEPVMGELELHAIEGATHSTAILHPDFLRECRAFLARTER